MRSRLGLKALAVLLFASALAAAPQVKVPAPPPVKVPPPQAPSPTPLPPECSGLPLPSSMAFAKSAYELRLGRFLRAGCYKLLEGEHDADLRATGPTSATLDDITDPHLPSWI